MLYAIYATDTASIKKSFMLKNYFIHVITIKRAETNFIAVKGLRIRQNITVALSPTADARSS